MCPSGIRPDRDLPKQIMKLQWSKDCTNISRATPSAAGPFWLLGIAIWEACFLLLDISGTHFGTSGAPCGTFGSTLGSHYRTSGPSWRTMKQQDALGVANDRIFVFWGLNLDLVYGISEGPKCLHFFGLVCRSFVHRFLNRHFDV